MSAATKDLAFSVAQEMTNCPESKEARETRAMELLIEGTAAKFMVANREEAKTKIVEAYKIARLEPKLGRRLLALTAYRLAHIMLRERNCILAEVDSYLVEALTWDSPDDSCLGPLPSIYRLAVLHRLCLKQKNQACREGIESKIREAHENAISYCNKSLGATVRQDSVYNLLELATYFLGLPYDIDGMGGPFYDLHEARLNPTEKSHWFIVGPDPAISKKRYPRLYAEEFIEERRKEHSHGLFFCLADDTQRPELSGGNGIQKSMSKHTAWFLVHLLRAPRVSGQRLRSKLGLSDDDAYRQALHRARKDLALVSGFDATETLQDGSEGLLVNPSLTIYGLVSNARFLKGPGGS